MADLFTPPDTGAPLDLDERLARVPATATVKGMFMQSVADEAKAVSGVAPGRGRWVAFKDYPLREWLALLVDCALVVHPRLPVREGLRRLGQNAYPTFAASTIGRVVMSVAGDNLAAALRQAPRAYSVSGSDLTAEVGAVTERGGLLHLRGAWDFPESWHAGVFEGVMRAFRKEGTVRVRVLSLCDVDFELTWR
jgi:uncharacterized protein (TIGR02265 family)